jgi:SsrA-binding protein
MEKEISGIKIIITNRRARRDYEISESFEAGIMLTGTEVKSLRQSRGSLTDSFARVEGSGVYLYHMHIPPYEQGNMFNVDPIRTRKLLFNKSEIKRLVGLTQQKGYTLIPLKVYFKRGYAKVEVALGKGKREYDHREDIKKRDIQREVERALGERQQKKGK